MTWRGSRWRWQVDRIFIDLLPAMRYDRCNWKGMTIMRYLGLVLWAVALGAPSVRAVGPLNIQAAAADIPPLSDVSLKKFHWVNQEILEAYDAIGHHDAKWDKAAREALTSSVEMWGPPR